MILFSLLAAINPGDSGGSGGIEPIHNPVISGLANKNADAAPAILGNFIASFVAVVLIAGTIYALFQFLIGGFEWISSGGDEGNLEKAQARLKNAIIGLIILAVTWTFYLTVLNWLGIIGSSSGGGFQFKIPSLL